MALVLGTNSGFVTTAPTADPNETGTTIDGSSVVTKHTTPADAEKITSIGWYRASGTNTANWEIALYSDLVGVPTTRLFVDATNSTSSNGWVTTAVDWAVSPNTDYWLALQMDAHSGSSSVDGAASGGAGSDVMTSQTTLADPYGGGLVADADGMYAIYALVQLSVTGSGTPTAQAAASSGAGVSSSDGTGTPAAQAATASGAGLSAWGAEGAPAAQAATAAGAGVSESTGTGAPAAQAAAASGEGISASTGTGAPVAQSASASGAGISESTGTGAPAAQAGAVSGEGVAGSDEVTGSGTPAAQAAGVSGSGSVSDGAAAEEPEATVSGGVYRSAQWRPAFVEIPPPVITGRGVFVAGQCRASGSGRVVHSRRTRVMRMLQIS